MKIVVSFHNSDGDLYNLIKDFFYENPEIEIYGRNLTNHFKQGPQELHRDAEKLNDRLSSPDLALVLLSQNYLSADWLSTELYALLNLERFKNKVGEFVIIAQTSDIDFELRHKSLQAGINPDIDFRVDKNTALRALSLCISNAALQIRRGSGANQQDQSQTKGETVYNIHGANPRFNLYSQDYSLNISKQSVENVFADLRQAISSQIENSEEQAALLDKLTELEQAKGTKTFNEKYREFMALAANHVETIAPFIPLLSQLLGG